MDTQPDALLIDARRSAGLSYAQIATELGGTKDAIRGKHQRWLATQATQANFFAVLPEDDNASPKIEWKPVYSAPTPGYIGFSMGYFDLEASSLNGSFGRLFSGACAHAIDGDEWSARIDDPLYRNKRSQSDDSKLAVAIRDHLLTHDIIVSWNGKRGYNSKGRSGFDIPMLNARLIQPANNQRVIGRYAPKHIDLLKEIRKYIELHSFRLAAVQEFLELAEEKNAILPRLWNKALDGDKEALDYIVLHNLKDVRVLRLVFEAMRTAGLLERPSW